MTPHLRCAACLFLLLGASTEVAGQRAARGRTTFAGRADAVFLTGYHWRGLWRSQAPVLQFDAAGGVVGPSLGLTGGYWLSVEPAKAESGERHDLPPGESGWTEQNAWLQASARHRALSVAGGVLYSLYHQANDEPHVVEVYGLARLQSGRLVTAIDSWFAVDGAHGAYLEPSISYIHAANPFDGPAFSWVSRLGAGFQLGERLQPGDAAVPGASGTGLTHASMSTSANVAFRLWRFVGVTTRFTIDAQYRRDPAIRLTRDGTQGRELRLWFPLQVGLTVPHRRPE